MPGRAAAAGANFGDGIRGGEPLHDTILDAWRTNDRVMTWFLENLPAEVWAAGIPGSPRRTVRRMAAHIHNSRCRWIKTLGSHHGVAVPTMMDPAGVTPRRLLPALRRSGRGILQLLQLALEHGGTLAAPSAYVWRNLPLDVGHVLSYFVAHEAHHRGQIVLTARAKGLRLEAPVVDGLWQWTTRSREASGGNR